MVLRFSIATTVLLWLAATTAAAQQSDWKHIALTTLGSVDVMLFYDTRSIRRMSAGTFQVWTKGVSAKQVANMTLSESARERVALRSLSGYKPPFARLNNLNSDQALDVMIIEEIVNTQPVETIMRVLYEIDCSARRIRLHRIYINLDGEEKHSDRTRDWTHIPPETPAASLVALLCRV